MERRAEASQSTSLRELTQWLEAMYEMFENTKAYGQLEIKFQDGRPVTYSESFQHRLDGRSRIRRHN